MAVISSNHLGLWKCPCGAATVTVPFSGSSTLRRDWLCTSTSWSPSFSVYVCEVEVHLNVADTADFLLNKHFPFCAVTESLVPSLPGSMPSPGYVTASFHRKLPLGWIASHEESSTPPVPSVRECRFSSVFFEGFITSLFKFYNLDKFLNAFPKLSNSVRECLILILEAALIKQNFTKECRNCCLKPPIFSCISTLHLLGVCYWCIDFYF